MANLYPSKEQLKDVIRTGNDNQDNLLILNQDVSFKLIPLDERDDSVTYVARHETFDSGNDYVGTRAADDAQFINQHYVESLEAWLNYVKRGSIKQLCDGSLLTKKSEEDLIKEINAQ